MRMRIRPDRGIDGRTDQPPGGSYEQVMQEDCDDLTLIGPPLTNH